MWVKGKEANNQKKETQRCEPGPRGCFSLEKATKGYEMDQGFQQSHRIRGTKTGSQDLSTNLTPKF